MQNVLLCFVGNRDPFVPGQPEEPGPILSLMQKRGFTDVFLVCTGSEYLRLGKEVEAAWHDSGGHTSFRFLNLELNSPIDFSEIYEGLRQQLETLRRQFGNRPYKLSVLLDPGTPQMQTVWFMLVWSGQLEAELLQGIPRRFGDGEYRVRTVDLSDSAFPGFPRPGPRDSRHATDSRQVLSVSGVAASHSEALSGRASATAGAPDGIRTFASPQDRPRRRRGDGVVARTSDITIVGSSAGFLRTLEQAAKVAPYDGTRVLITGETGTGKELVARSIHEQSPRAGNAFVAVNCAGITPSLAASELFGHRKGAFSGADRDRTGYFGAADGGTLFMDEVGELPQDVQAMVLRTLETGTIRPVGSDDETPVDVRVIAATNRDLVRMSGPDGGFRPDLLERLAQFSIHLPSLRERGEDILALADHFLQEWTRATGEARSFSEDVRTWLQTYHWPNNVRMLKNAVEQAAIMCTDGIIRLEDVPARLRQAAEPERGQETDRSPQLPERGINLKAVLHDLERSYIEQALARTAGNAEAAAGLLHWNGPALRKALRERFSGELEG